MTTTVAELLKALPVDESGQPISGGEKLVSRLADKVSTTAVPTGALQRLSLLSSLQAKLTLAYGFLWIRGFFQDADARQRDAAETHFRAAVKLLDTMGYMRGAVMKVGQLLAQFPDIVPDQLVETLEKLHFEAPPMHFSLLREMIVNELGDEPENLFAEFDEVAFAAASLGQVHRARLKTGEDAAVKIQYPGIARTIRTDFRNLGPLLLPSRLTRDWEHFKQQFEFLRRSIEQESDYEQEARNLDRARRLFHEEDNIVVPRVIGELSTSRILTMERLPGVHIDRFLQSNPSQELRNEYARKLLRSCCRIMYRGRMLNSDVHPGNYLFMPDGRLGLLDFGCVLPYDNAADWESLGVINRAIVTGREEDIRRAMRDWGSLSDGPEDARQLDAYVEFGKWCWRPNHTPGPFDYGNIEYIREGVEIFQRITARRYSRGHQSNLLQLRWNIGFTMMLYRLGANFDGLPILEEEVPAAGWDRSDYA